MSCCHLNSIDFALKNFIYTETQVHLSHAKSNDLTEQPNMFIYIAIHPITVSVLFYLHDLHWIQLTQSRPPSMPLPLLLGSACILCYFQFKIQPGSDNSLESSWQLCYMQSFLPEASFGLRVFSLPESVRQSVSLSVRHQVCPHDNSLPV